MDINNINRFEEILTNARKAVIAVHIHPDGDALGTGTAMLSFLKSIGLEATLLLPHPCPTSVSFLIEGGLDKDVIVCESDMQKAEEATRQCDLIICEDLNDFSRTGDIAKALENAKAVKVLVDHHIGPAEDKFDLVFSETGMSSAAEMLYNILMALPRVGGKAGNLPSLTTTALMTGMISDTNNFANSTSPETLKMASELISAGVDRDAILGHLYNSFSENRLRLQARLLRDMTIRNGVACMILTRGVAMKYKVHDSDTEGFVNLPLAIKDVKMSIFLKQDKDRFRVSIRSKKGVSANIFARKYFHGGGHELAAGGKLLLRSDIRFPWEAASYVNMVAREYFSTNE